MRTHLTLASLAALTQAIRLRQQNDTLTATSASNPDTTVTNYTDPSAIDPSTGTAVGTTGTAVNPSGTSAVNTTDNRLPVSDWIGKYHFKGATPEFLAAMHEKDVNQDGTVSVYELAEALIQSSKSLNREEVMNAVDAWVAEVGNEYAWYDDYDILTQTLPSCFDHNGDGMLTREEARDMYNFFGAGYLADQLFDQHSYLPKDKIAESVDRLRYGGNNSGAQVTANMASYMLDLYHLDHNGDGVVSVREWLNMIVDAIGIHAGDNHIAFDVDAMIAKCGGEGCDWLHQDEFIADVMSYGVDLSSFDSLYERFEAFKMPWIADIAFELGTLGIPATHQDFMNVAHRLKYEENFAQQPSDWIALGDRLVPGIPNVPTQEQIVQYTQEEIADAQQILHSILSVDITAVGYDFHVTQAQIQELHDLMILLERFVV